MPEDTGYTGAPNAVEAAGQFVTGRYKVWTESMRPQRDRWVSLQKRYENNKEDRPQGMAGKVRTNLGIPLAAQTVDTTMARMVQDLFSRSPYGRYRPTDPEDQVNADQMQKVVNYQQRITNFTREASKVVKDALWAGTGHAKLIFDVQKQVLPVPRLIQDLVPEGTTLPFGLGEIQIGTKKEKRTVLETPRLVHISCFDSFYPIDAPSVEDAEGFIHRTWQTPRSLRGFKDGLGRPLFDPADIKAVQDFKQSVDADQQAKQQHVTRGETGSNDGMHKYNKLELLEYTGKLPEAIANQLVATHYPGSDPDGDWFVTTVNGGNTTLRAEPVPHFTLQRSFFLCKVNEDGGRLTGIGILERVEKLALLIDGLYSNIVDNMNIINNRPVYINKTSGLKKSQVVFGPGKVWEGRTSPREAIQVVDSPDISQSVWLLIRLLTSHFKEYTGVTDPVLSQASSGDQTATEFQGLLASAATRNGLHERTIENTFLKPLFQMWCVFNQQYLTDEFYIRMDKGAEYQLLRVRPEDLQGVFDVEFEGSSRQQSQAIMASQIMQLIQIEGAMPVPAHDIPKLMMKLTKDAFGWQDAEDLLNPLFAQQMQMMNAMTVMQKLGETKQALSPEAQKQTPGNTAPKKGTSSKTSGGGSGSTPHNAPNPITDADVLRGVSEMNNPDVIQRQA